MRVRTATGDWFPGLLCGHPLSPAMHSDLKPRNCLRSA